MNATTTNIEKEIIQRETEKAICIRMSGSHLRSGDQIGFDMWIPKSVVKNNEIPFWILSKNGKEKGFSSISFYGGSVGVIC